MNGTTLRLSAGVKNYCLEVIYILFQSMSTISVINNGYLYCVRTENNVSKDRGHKGDDLPDHVRTEAVRVGPSRGTGGPTSPRQGRRAGSG